MEQILKQILSVALSMLVAVGTLFGSFFPQLTENHSSSSSQTATDSKQGITYSLDYSNFSKKNIEKILVKNFRSFSPNMTFTFETPLNKEETKNFEKVISDCLYHVISDDPDIFWIANKSYYLSWYYVDEKYTSLTLSFSYSETKKSAEARSKKIEEAVNNIVKEAPTDNTFLCLKYFHDSIITTTNYDSDTAAINSSVYEGKEDSFNITGVFLNHLAVCEGYAKAFKYLCDQVYIPCRVVFGTAYHASHAWDLVTIDGRDYLIDATWDDQDTTIYASFLKGKNGLVGKTPASEIYKTDSSTANNWAKEDYSMDSLLPKFRGEFIPNS